MKRYLFYFAIIFTFFSTRVAAQSDNVKIYVFPTCWGPQSKQYLQANHTFEFINIMTQGSIASRTSDTILSPGTVRRFLVKRYPDPESKGIILLDWEGKILDNLRDRDTSDARFKYSQSQFLELIKTVKTTRPGLKVAVYGLPFKFFNAWQKNNYNPPAGKLNAILSQVDIIAPSYYISYPDEKVKHERNLKFFKENLDVALTYGMELKKPVVPLVWHKVHSENKVYPKALIQPETFAAYVKFISSYSFRNNQVSGLMWWDDMKENARIKNIKSLSNWTKGKVTDGPTYDTMMIEYASRVCQSVHKKSPE